MELLKDTFAFCPIGSLVVPLVPWSILLIISPLWWRKHVCCMFNIYFFLLADLPGSSSFKKPVMI